MNFRLASNADLMTCMIGPAGKELANLSLLDLFGIRVRNNVAATTVHETLAPYVIHPEFAAAKELYLRAMSEKMETATVFADPDSVKHFLRGKLGHLDHEEFWVMYFNAQNHLIVAECAFTGTLTQTSVYPREVAKRALMTNCASVIFAHNHPSGVVTPSRADECLTTTLKAALALVDVRAMDHLVVTSDASYSMAEHGLM